MAHSVEVLLPAQRYVFALENGRAVPQPASTSAEGFHSYKKVQREGKVEASWQPSESGPPRRYYALNPAGVEALRAYFDRFWNHALAAFARAVEQQPPQTPDTSANPISGPARPS